MQRVLLCIFFKSGNRHVMKKWQPKIKCKQLKKTEKTFKKCKQGKSIDSSEIRPSFFSRRL